MILALFALFAVVQVYWLFTATSEQDVRNLIDRNLSEGATSEEILAFLDRARIEHSDVHSAGDATLVKQAGYEEGTDIISATMRDTTKTWLGNVDIQIIFFLDESGALVDYVVEGYQTTL